MKALFRLLLTLALLVEACAYAASGTTAPNNLHEKSRQNADRRIFGPFVAKKMSDAFDGKLAARYPCGYKPDYYCQGLMVTAFESDTTYWMDPKTEKISLTYFRQDIATLLFGTAGLVLWPQAYLDHDFPMVGQAHQSFKPVYRCAFPQDGNSNGRADSGCGALIFSTGPVPDTGPCASLGITTAEQWLNKYREAGWSICGFGLNRAGGTDLQGMSVVIQVDRILQKTGAQGFPWNEIVMAPWPSYAPSRIPLMAFFWIPGQDTKAPESQAARERRLYQSLSATQKQQKRYYDLTRIFVPIIEISEASPKAAFTYRDEDQAPGIPNIVTTMPQ